jgi:hypothetical protein
VSCDVRDSGVFEGVDNPLRGLLAFFGRLDVRVRDGAECDELGEVALGAGHQGRNAVSQIFTHERIVAECGYGSFGDCQSASRRRFSSARTSLIAMRD